MSIINYDNIGHITESKTFNLEFAGNVRKFAVEVNQPPPSISEYIAYDELDPPNPFLAVTQDGNGNVVYDGGFPKFYNGKAPDVGASFAQLEGGFKFLYNALNFVAKDGHPNNKMLLIGDQTSGNSYSVKDTNSNGFYTSMTRIAEIAGYTLTVKDPDDWGGSINPTLAELNEYCAVIVMGTHGGSNPDVVTDPAVADFVTYRLQGGGLIFITDHGPDLTSIQDATTTSGGFFDGINKITVQFGAYFTGDFNRSPVNVGYLRQNYGDHPLYNGMADSDDISAGGSESRVVVATAAVQDVNGTYDISLSSPADDGIHRFNFLMVDDSGNTSTDQVIVTVGEGNELFRWQEPDGPPADPVRLFRTVPFELVPNYSGVGTVEGEFGIVPQLPMMRFRQSPGSAFEVVQNDLPVDDGVWDTGYFTITYPFRYEQELVTTDFTVTPENRFNQAEILKELDVGSLAGLDSYAVFRRVHAERKRLLGTTVFTYPTPAECLGYLRSQYEAIIEGVRPLQMVLTNNDVMSYFTSGTEPVVYCIETNRFHIHREGGGWIARSSLQMARVLNTPCRIESSLGGHWVFHRDGTVVQD